MREEAEVEAVTVMIAVFKACHLMSIFVGLGAALQAGKCEQANSGRAGQHVFVLAHVGSFDRALNVFDVIG
jgi:hypothetical protein